MPSQFFGLNIGMKSLNAFQAAISATANNISNVQTEGYSRQVAKIQSSEAMRVHATYGSAGTGVDVVEIKQERNLYYDEQYWKNQSSVGYFEKRLYYINQIEATLADDSVQEGFSTIFNKVFNSLDRLNGGNASDESMRNEICEDVIKEKIKRYRMLSVLEGILYAVVFGSMFAKTPPTVEIPKMNMKMLRSILLAMLNDFISYSSSSSAECLK